MKSKEIIRQIRSLDPSGELEVVLKDNRDIHFVDVMGAYRDGMVEQLVRDPDVEGYNVIGAKVRSKGLKLCIIPLSIADAIFSDPDLPVDLGELRGDDLKDYESTIDKLRRKARRILAEVDAET